MLIYYYAYVRIVEYTDTLMLRAYNTVVFLQLWITIPRY